MRRMITADMIAFYAAFVGTAALALELRRWFESGPRLIVRVSPNMEMLDRLGKRWILVEVSNRGDTATTITHLGMVGFPSRLARLRHRPDPSYLVPKPEGQPLPHLLEPGGRWIGLMGDDALFDWVDEGNAFAQVSAIDRDRPFYRRIPKPPRDKDRPATSG